MGAHYVLLTGLSETCFAEYRSPTSHQTGSASSLAVSCLQPAVCLASRFCTMQGRSRIACGIMRDVIRRDKPYLQSVDVRLRSTSEWINVAILTLHEFLDLGKRAWGMDPRSCKPERLLSPHHLLPFLAFLGARGLKEVVGSLHTGNVPIDYTRALGASCSAFRMQ
ncbi:hypothetical protein BDV11DRAFT_66004 [Aspergillus similis]